MKASASAFQVFVFLKIVVLASELQRLLHYYSFGCVFTTVVLLFNYQLIYGLMSALVDDTRSQDLSKVCN